MPSAASLGLADYPHVDMLGVRDKSANALTSQSISTRDPVQGLDYLNRTLRFWSDDSATEVLVRRTLRFWFWSGDSAAVGGATSDPVQVIDNLNGTTGFIGGAISTTFRTFFAHYVLCSHILSQN